MTKTDVTGTSYTDVNRRHDFVLLFDVSDGNPNGDPDAGNLPRVDPETMQGLVTDVAIKRKVRDWIDMSHGDEEHFKIYVQSGEALNAKHRRAYEAEGIKPLSAKQPRSDVDRVRDFMCRNFYDIRMFGAVMTTGVNAGQVRGPLQLTFARSLNPIVPLDISITRIAVTREEEAGYITTEEGSGDNKRRKEGEMGRKALVPYGLYRAYGFFNPHFAEKTGVTEEDLALFWQALQEMWNHDRSASRGMMACRGLYIFSHESKLGNAHAHKLFERVVVGRSQEPGRLEADAPRSFGDYKVTVADSDLPQGVTLTRLCE